MPESLYTAFNQGMRLSRPWANAQGRYNGYYNKPGVNALARTPGADEDFFVYTIGPNPQTNAGLTLAPGASAILNFQIQADSSFELHAITCQSYSGVAPAFPSLVTMMLSDGGTGRNLFSAPVPLALVAGATQNTNAGMLPHWLTVARRFVSNSQLNVSLLNTDTAVTFSNLEISFIGRKIYNRGRPANAMGSRGNMFRKWRGEDGLLYSEDYYAYLFNLATLASLATQPIQTVMESDSDFETILLSAGCIRNATTGGLSPVQGLQMQWQDGGEQRNLFSNPTNWGQITGLGNNPLVLPLTRIFLAKTPVTFTLTSVDTAVAMNDIYILMEGRKIFQLDE